MYQIRLTREPSLSQTVKNWLPSNWRKLQISRMIFIQQRNYSQLPHSSFHTPPSPVNNVILPGSSPKAMPPGTLSNQSMIMISSTSLNPSTHFIDPLPPTIFKKIKAIILHLLTKIANVLLRQGTIPDCLKVGQVIPTLKNLTLIAQILTTTVLSTTSPL